MTILLKEIWPIADLQGYKCHYARWNNVDQPLDVWVRDRREWQGWQEYRPARDDFNRPHIFSLIQFYHESDTWLFGGVFDVIERLADRYVVELSEHGANFTGRLILRSSYRNRSTRVNFDNHYADFEVSEILKEPYSGEAFPGYDNIDVSFAELEALVRNNRPDWKAALSSVKGVYLISDTSTGKKYVGSAYGNEGIWSRWQSYVGTGHGGNVELRELVRDPTLAYCRQFFRLALLEHRSTSTPDDFVIQRESFWKQVLLTRGEHGLNRN